MTCWLFHKWGKWQQYIWHGEICHTGIAYPSDIRGKWIDVTQNRQKRACDRCGKVQEELISKG